MPIKYELIIYWSDDDQSFVVDVPELPGCMANGETYEQAVVSAQTVRAGYYMRSDSRRTQGCVVSS
jgi:predicted RNase H-like HicB family nuclease